MAAASHVKKPFRVGRKFNVTPALAKRQDESRRAAAAGFKRPAANIFAAMAASKKPIDAAVYDTDKAAHAHYLRNYEGHFKHLVGRDVRLPELGVYHGGSLLLWRDYFERGTVVGLDLNPV